MTKFDIINYLTSNKFLSKNYLVAMRCFSDIWSTDLRGVGYNDTLCQVHNTFTCSKGSVLCRFFCTHGLLSLCLNLHKLLLFVWRLGPTWSSRSLPAMVTKTTCSSRRETTRKVHPQFMNVHVQSTVVQS